MQGKGALIGVNVTTGLFSTILLAKLIVDLVNKKKKVEEIYLELVCTIGIFLLCVVTAVFLAREKKEYKEIEHSGSNLSLDNSDEKVEEKEGQSLLKRHASCPERLNNKTTSAEEVRNTAEKIKSTMVKGDTSEADIYYNLTGQQTNIKHFGRDESIIAVTFPKNYSIKKYKNGREIQNTKKSVIDNDDKYKPIDFSVNKIEKVNDKGKKGDSYQFTFKFQNMQKDDVYIEINCETLNVYSGWKENEEKPVAQYFKDLNIKAEAAAREISIKGTEIEKKELKKLKEKAVKVNDDFLIFLDVKEILSGSLKKILDFLQRFFPANDQGLSSVEGKAIFKHFEVELLQEEPFSSLNVKNFYLIGKENLVKFNVSMDKTFPIKDILVNDQLISKKQEIEQEHQNDVDQDIRVDEPTDQNVTTSKEISNIPQSQKKEDETNLPGVSSVPSSPSTSSDIGSDRTSISDIATTESKEKSAQKQSVSRSSSRSFSGSKESVDSAGQPKKKSFLNSLKQGVSGVGKKLKKVKNKLKKDKNIKSNEVSPSSSVDTLSTASVGDISNPGFVKK